MTSQRTDIQLGTYIDAYNTLITEWNTYFSRELTLPYIIEEEVEHSLKTRIILYLKGYESQKRKISTVIQRVYPYTTSTPSPKALLSNKPSQTVLAKKILLSARAIHKRI